MVCQSQFWVGGHSLLLLLLSIDERAHQLILPLYFQVRAAKVAYLRREVLEESAAEEGHLWHADLPHFIAFAEIQGIGIHFVLPGHACREGARAADLT